MIIDFGKANKGKEISECDSKYLQWLVSHERVLAKRNRWASRDAKIELERRAQAEAVKAAPKVNENWQDWHQSLKIVAKPVSNDVGMRGNLNTSRAFSLMR